MDVPPFEVSQNRDGSESTLRVRGELDFGTAPVMRDALAQVLEDDVEHLILDMKDVTFLDSEGVKLLLQTYKHVRESGGAMSIRGCSRFVQNVFEILGLQHYLEISAT